MSQILAIDQSTSATKALLYSDAGALIDKASLDHQQIYPKPGWVEHDAEVIWQNTLAVLNKLKIDNPHCLSITNQRETIVIFDRATGKPLRNAIVWQCRRGDAICNELKSNEPTVARKTGLKIDPYFSASKLAWVMRNEPEIASALRTGKAIIGTIDCYLIYRLTGGKVFATDHTNASRTLLFDIEKLRWDEGLCGMFAVPMTALPEVRDSTANFGTAKVGDRSIPIIGVMGDSQAALFAQRCYSPGSAKVTIGTGSSVLLNIGDTLKHAEQGTVSTIAWTHQGKATYCYEGIINYSAATIAWLKDQLGIIHDVSETESIAKSVPDNGGVYLVPAFVGLGAPHWAPGAKAAIVGMTSATNRNHIVRAGLESIAYQISDVLEMMRQGAGVNLQSIHADGGATRNNFLCQFIADITQTDLIVSQMPDCSSLGAAMAGLAGSRGLTLSDLQKLPKESVTYQPQMSAGESEKLRAGWNGAVKQVLAGIQPS